jgi:hypothetical protein
VLYLLSYGHHCGAEKRFEHAHDWRRETAGNEEARPNSTIHAARMVALAVYECQVCSFVHRAMSPHPQTLGIELHIEGEVIAEPAFIAAGSKPG